MAVEKLTYIHDFILKPGDVVFLMTDGYWQELPLENQLENRGQSHKKSIDGNFMDIIVKKSIVRQGFIREVVEAVNKDNPYPQAFDYLKALHRRSIANSATSRENYRKLKAVIEQIDPEDKKPISIHIILFFLRGY